MLPVSIGLRGILLASAAAIVAVPAVAQVNPQLPPVTIDAPQQKRVTTARPPRSAARSARPSRTARVIPAAPAQAANQGVTPGARTVLTI